MRYLLIMTILSLSLNACGKISLKPPGSGGGGAEGSAEDLGPGAARTLKIADFPTSEGQLWGKWAITEPIVNADGGSFGLKLFFSRTQMGMAKDCVVSGYDVTAALSVPALYGRNGLVNIPAAGRKDNVSGDGAFRCTATVAAGTFTYQIQQDYLYLTDTKSGTRTTFKRLYF